MKTYIVGSGGVGGYFGGLLAKAGEDVTFLARGNHYQVLKDKGLTVKSIVGDFKIKPVKVIDKISQITSPKLVIFAVKTYDTDETAKALAQVVDQDTVVITFQNGVDNDLQIKKYVEKGEVYPGVAYVISTKVAPGLIEQTGGLRKLIFGDRKNSSNTKLKEIEKMMQKAGVDATASNDIVRDLWKKFMFIIPFAGMTAICRSSIGKILSDSVTRQSYEGCLQETIAVAKAMGVKIDADAFKTIMTISEKTAPASKSSLVVDIEKKRKNEIESLNGALVKFAERVKVDVPINRLIYGAIKIL